MLACAGVRPPRGARGTDPSIQVHRYDLHTYVLRQSKALTAEAPFLYLLLGSDRAALFDTGASKKTGDEDPLRETVDQIVHGWLAEHPRENYELVVAHTQDAGPGSAVLDGGATQLAFGWPAQIDTVEPQ